MPWSAPARASPSADSASLQMLAAVTGDGIADSAGGGAVGTQEALPTAPVANVAAAVSVRGADGLVCREPELSGR